MAKQTIIYGSFVSVYYYLLCFFNFCLLNLFIYVVLGYHVLWWNKVVFNSPQPVGGPSKRKKIRGPRARAQCAHWLRRPWHSQHTKHAITWAVHRKRSHLGVLHACDAPDSCPNVKSTACARHLKQSHQPPPQLHVSIYAFRASVVSWSGDWRSVGSIKPASMTLMVLLRGKSVDFLGSGLDYLSGLWLYSTTLSADRTNSGKHRTHKAQSDEHGTS